MRPNSLETGIIRFFSAAVKRVFSLAKRSYIAYNMEVMSLEGYTDYKRREFCKDVKCPAQLDLDAQKEGSEEHERIRKICKTNCKYTTYQFHHWLIDKGYLIIRAEK